MRLGRRGFLLGGRSSGAGALAAACTSNARPQEQGRPPDDSPTGANAAPGKKVTIGFAGPQADHGWINAINENAKKEAGKYSDVELKITEGSNDAAQQASQIQTLINQKVDVLVILPADGKQMTPTGRKAMTAGIPVINLDRVFDTPQAYRTWIGGDNYGMGLNAGNYIAKQLKGKGTVVELAGIDTLPLTQDRTQGLRRRAAQLPAVQEGRPGGGGVHRGVGPGHAWPSCCRRTRSSTPCGTTTTTRASARSRRSSRRAATSSSWSAAPAPRAPWTPSRRTTACSRRRCSTRRRWPPRPSRSPGCSGRSKGMSDLAEQEIPTSITLFSAMVTKENVDTYLPLAFE